MGTTFEEAYEQRDLVFGARPDGMLRRLVTERHLRGRALDLGAGDGRNSLFLARQGFAVEAVDVAAEAVAKLRARATAVDLPVAARVCDIRHLRLAPERYDLVVADTVLCHLALVEVRRRAAAITAALRPGGWVYASVFDRADPGESEFAALVRTRFEPDTLCSLFPRLRTETCEQRTVTDRRHGQPHRHVLLLLLAQKGDGQR